MTLNITFTNNERKEIEGVYQIGEAYGRVYIHFKSDEPGQYGDHIDTVNYPKFEIVDIVIDFE